MVIVTLNTKTNKHECQLILNCDILNSIVTLFLCLYSDDTVQPLVVKARDWCFNAKDSLGDLPDLKN